MASFRGVLDLSAQIALKPSLAMAMAAPHASTHTCIETLPRGARGKDRIHSMYDGTQPAGSQNIAFRLCQNCSSNRRPVVPSHRTELAIVSNRARVDLTLSAVQSVMSV